MSNVAISHGPSGIMLTVGLGGGDKIELDVDNESALDMAVALLFAALSRPDCNQEEVSKRFAERLKAKAAAAKARREAAESFANARRS